MSQTTGQLPTGPYPDAPRDDTVDVLAGHEVPDPYRWLEDTEDRRTAMWSTAEKELTDAWFEVRPSRAVIAERLEALLPGFESAPTVVGERRFITERRPGQDHAVLRVEQAGRAPEVLVDPNALSEDGTVTLDYWSPSIEGDRLAYQLSSGGDEESRLWIMDVGTGQLIEGPIGRLRYSPVAWLPGGDEVFYVRRLDPALVPAGEEAYHRRVWRHRIGADPATDVMVFGDGAAGEGAEATAYYGVATSDDGRWVVVSLSLGTAPRNEVWISEVTDGAPWRRVLAGVDAQAWPHLDRQGRLWLLTDLDAPRGRLCVVDAGSLDPGPSAWREVVAEDPEAVLEDAIVAGDDLVVVRSRHATSEISVVDANGVTLREVTLPGPGSAGVTGRRDEGPEVWVGFTDYTRPYQVGRVDVATGRLEEPTSGNGVPGAALGSTGAGSEVMSHLVTYRSADGTEVRLTVIAAGVTVGGPRPTVLYGYGGFGVPMTPAYSSTILGWVAAGGVWAVANLRGGSEEGEAWHRAGMRENKQRVFEDFEAAGEWLVAEGWTTPAMLGILGGSNGGLLVGAALTRRPDLWRAAVCSAPLLDMVRYERFGLGATWSDEFGTASEPAELAWLLGYSPYHHVTAGMSYPAVLFTVFDRDTRVDPLHARKMAAALQAGTVAPLDERPILLRAEADVGHGSRSVRRSVALAADELAFLGDQVGLDVAAQR
ncbi:MAG: prolyl oligopeptidase family serine peptidase [Actinomycetota bacterium]|nr:prolyl oligopeptidase family serine peptidase [Actinomycetota bacterium]